MKKLIHPASGLLYLLSILVFFFVGAYFSILTGGAEGQGLAAAGIVVGTGFFFSVAAFFVAVAASWYMDRSVVRILNLVLLSLLLVLIAITVIRFRMRKEKGDAGASPGRVPTPTVPAMLVHDPGQHSTGVDRAVGLGMFSPDLSHSGVLYFHSTPGEVQEGRAAPVDSIVFVVPEGGQVRIDYAPPWLAPERLKMDYQIILFRVMSVGQSHLELLVNAPLEKTLYVDRTSGSFWYWPDFLLQVYALKPVDRNKNPVRVRPFQASSVIAESCAFMRAMRVKDEWVFVQLHGDDRNIVNSGWLQWRVNGKLVVDYDVLS